MVKPAQTSEDPDYVYDEGVTDGEFALDVLGTLSGNWLREGCLDKNGWYGWEDELAFGYDIFYPNQIRIGIGISSNPFALKNEDNPIKPEEASISSGVITYYLYNGNNTSKGLPTANRTGLMIVQILSETRIKLEIFNDTTSNSREFTSNATFFTR